MLHAGTLIAHESRPWSTMGHDGEFGQPLWLTVQSHIQIGPPVGTSAPPAWACICTRPRSFSPSLVSGVFQELRLCLQPHICMLQAQQYPRLLRQVSTLEKLVEATVSAMSAGSSADQ